MEHPAGCGLWHTQGLLTTMMTGKTQAFLVSSGWSIHVSVLHRFRTWAKWIVAISFGIDVAWYVLSAVVGLATLAIVVIQGRYDRLGSLLVSSVGAVGVLGFATWVFWDVRRVGRRLRSERAAAACRNASRREIGDGEHRFS